MVRGQERRPHPDLAQRWLRLHQEPGPESDQEEHPGEQAGAKSRKRPHHTEARASTVLSSECLIFVLFVLQLSFRLKGTQTSCNKLDLFL